MYEELTKDARENHRYTSVESEINELCDAIDDLERLVSHYKELYVSAIKSMDCDICEKCIYYHECKGEDCPSYISGRGGYIGEKYYDYKWSCKDFNYGECAVLENTPCKDCFNNDFSGFTLKEVRN